MKSPSLSLSPPRPLWGDTWRRDIFAAKSTSLIFLIQTEYVYIADII